MKVSTFISYSALLCEKFLNAFDSGVSRNSTINSTSTRPIAPSFIYKLSSVGNFGQYIDRLQNVSYVLVGSDDLVQVNGTYPKGTQFAPVIGVSDNVLTCQIRSVMEIMTSVYSTDYKDNVFFQIQTQTNGTISKFSILIKCLESTDLQSVPFIYYNPQGYLYKYDEFYLSKNWTIIYTNSQYNFTSTVNSTTGMIIGWNETLFNSSSPVISDMSWVDYNCNQGDLYALGWISSVFYEFPRISGASSFFVYPTSPDFNTYIVGILFSVSPFLALIILTCLCVPTHSLLSILRRLNCCKSIRHKLCGCLYLNPLNSSPYDEAVNDEKTENDQVLLSTVENLNHETTNIDAHMDQTDPTNRIQSSLSSGPQRYISRRSTLSVFDRFILLRYRRMKRSTAKKLRVEVNTIKDEINGLIQPPNFLARWFVVFLIVIEAITVPFGFILIPFYVESLGELGDSAYALKDTFLSASGASKNISLTISNFLSSCQVDSFVGELISVEATILNRYSALVDPNMIAISQESIINYSRTIIVAVWISVNIILAVLVGLLLSSAFLTCCTFKWGEEKVICTRLSFHLGSCSIQILLIGMTILWFSIGFICAALLMTSDFCSKPSAILANTTYANLGSPTKDQIEYQIYTFFTQPFGIEFLTPGHSLEVVSSFNIGNFLSSCLYGSRIFNPYSYLLNFANTIHQMSVNSMNTSNTNCTQGKDFQDFPYSSITFNIFETSCTNLGAIVGTPLRTFCLESVDGALSSLFIYFVLQWIFISSLLILWAFRYAMVPSIYKIKKAQALHKAMQSKHTELKKILREVHEETSF